MKHLLSVVAAAFFASFTGCTVRGPVLYDPYYTPQPYYYGSYYSHPITVPASPRVIAVPGHVYVTPGWGYRRHGGRGWRH
jgi:hypothetical protein